MSLLLYSALVFMTSLAGLCAGTDELIAVVQIFRHGQRSPLSFYKNDPYADLNTYFAGLNYGQLTNEGKRQHYALGQTTRKRYSKFLPKKYNRSDIHVQTTDVDRTHMSAQANIHGLYPASGNEVWKFGSTWQPIPVHPANSSILNGDVSCSNYGKLVKDILLGDDFTAIDARYAELYEYLTEYSGDNVTNVEGVYNIWDVLMIENDIGFPLPSWASEVFPYPIRNLSGNYFEMFTHTTQLKRLFIGPWLNEVVTYLENMATNSSYSEKYQMYSAHDSNIAAILNSFGAFDPPFPPYFASSIWMELWRKNWQHVVNIYNKDDTTTTQISIKGCDLDCPIASVRELLKDIIVDVETRDIECQALYSN